MIKDREKLLDVEISNRKEAEANKMNINDKVSTLERMVGIGSFTLQLKVNPYSVVNISNYN